MQNKASSILVIVTGGTFDKEYNELNGELFFRHTHVDSMLKMGRCLLPYRIEVLMLMDSLEMVPEDRQKIVDLCKSAPETHIVITHGTDTMTQTAEFIAKAFENMNKTIVLTGAMIPYTFGSSDGMFNLGCSMAFAQVLPPGVFVAMNGCIFEWNHVLKNRERGIFEAI